MRYDYEQHNTQIPKKFGIFTEEYPDRVAEGNLPTLEINCEIEHLRTNNGRDFKIKRLMRKHKVRR